MAKSIPIASTIATGIEQVRKRASQKDLTSLSVLFTNPTTQYTVVERLARQLTLAQANTLHALPSLSPLKKTQDTLMGHTNNAATAKALEDSEIILDGMLVEHPVNEQKPYAIDDYVALLYQDVMGENAVYVSPVSLTPHRKKSQSMTLTVQSPDALSLPSRSSSYDSPKAIKTPSARSNHSQTSSLPISAYSSSLMSLENHRLSQQLQKQVRLTQMLAANNQTLKQQVAQIPQLQQQLSAVNDKNEKMEQQLSAVNDKNKKMEQQMLMMQKQVMAMQQWMEQQKMASTSAQLSPKPNDQ
jgi:hypothetical protein